MKRVVLSVAVMGMLAGAGCRLRLDEAESLAYDVRYGAERLKNSNRAEEIVEYAPPNELEYAIRFEVSESLQAPYTGGLVVGPDWVGSRGGSATTYHARFVYVPKPLYIKKRGAPAHIVLKKNGDRIEVTDIW